MRFQGGVQEFSPMIEAPKSTTIIKGTCTKLEKQYLRLTMVPMYPNTIAGILTKFILSSGCESSECETGTSAAEGSENGATTVGRR